jgi:hypothetical protein
MLSYQQKEYRSKYIHIFDLNFEFYDPRYCS